MNIHIVWFKRDLRLHDHAPLSSACQAGRVIPLYIVEPELWQQPDSSFRHWQFIYDSLVDLKKDLQQQNADLVVRRGDVLSVLTSIHAQVGNFTLWSHEETGNLWSFKRDIDVAHWCKQHSIIWHELGANAVKRRLKTRDTWSKLRNEIMQAELVPAPQYINFFPIQSDDLPKKILDVPVKTIHGQPIFIQAGARQAGLKTLHSFLNHRAEQYMQNISKPSGSVNHCSRLSPHIAYGTLSVREIEQTTQRQIDQLKQHNSGESLNKVRNLTAFLSRLAWRCHFVQKLEQQPEIETACIHPAFEALRAGSFREDFFEAWKTGNTGYPLVDACMRALHQNGWITFRMRAMLVSFASYHLWLDWRSTAPFLAQMFTDYEPGIHYSQFQMQSGTTGMNALRIYNPIKQSYDHDANGFFIRKYVPELKHFDASQIHEPWLHSSDLKYPQPIIDLDAQTKAAKLAIANIWKTDDFKETAQAIKQKLASRMRQSQRKTTSKSKPSKPKTNSNDAQFDLFS